VRRKLPPEPGISAYDYHAVFGHYATQLSYRDTLSLSRRQHSPCRGRLASQALAGAAIDFQPVVMHALLASAAEQPQSHSSRLLDARGERPAAPRMSQCFTWSARQIWDDPPHMSGVVDLGLNEATIHMWSVAVPKGRQRLFAVAGECLSAEERERAARYRFDRDRGSSFGPAPTCGQSLAPIWA